MLKYFIYIIMLNYYKARSLYLKLKNQSGGANGNLLEKLVEVFSDKTIDNSPLEDKITELFGPDNN